MNPVLKHVMTASHRLKRVRLPGTNRMFRVDSPEKYLELQALEVARLVEAGQLPPATVPTDAPADVRRHVYINEGRVLIDCLCNNGINVEPDWPVAPCCLCGLIYRAHHLVWPDTADLEDADDVLGARPLNNRNWSPTQETLGDLRTENARHGFVVPPRRGRPE